MLDSMPQVGSLDIKIGSLGFMWCSATGDKEHVTEHITPNHMLCLKTPDDMQLAVGNQNRSQSTTKLCSILRLENTPEGVLVFLLGFCA